MKKNIILLLLVIFLIPIKVDAYNLTPSVDNKNKIYDYANLLTEKEEKKLESSISKFINKGDYDMVIVTISTNPYGVGEDYYSERYAEDFYSYNLYGVGNSNDGMLILLDMSNRNCYIKLFGNAIQLYSDSDIENMHDNAFDYLSNDDYYEALDSYINDVYSYAYPKKSINPFWSLFIAGFTSSIALFVHIKKYKGIKLATNADDYLGKINITEQQDHFLTTFTTRVAIPHDSGGSSGSSSGSSHSGGGGRHF